MRATEEGTTASDHFGVYVHLEALLPPSEDFAIDSAVMDMHGALPDSLQPFAKSRAWSRITIGDSADTFRLDREGEPALYLKVCRSLPQRELLRERERLDWLRGRLPVPEVVHYEVATSREYLLLTSIPGQDAASLSKRIPHKHIVRTLAIGLRMIHGIPIGDCPFDATLDKSIEEARNNVAGGLVDERKFDSIRQRRSAEDLLAELLSTRPPSEDLVFTHGDYCLPNVLLLHGELSGFVDWGRAGVADRYRDIALVVRSLEKNTGEDFSDTFLEAYGLSSRDADRVEYYKLLDEFW